MQLACCQPECMERCPLVMAGYDCPVESVEDTVARALHIDSGKIKENVTSIVCEGCSLACNVSISTGPCCSSWCRTNCQESSGPVCTADAIAAQHGTGDAHSGQGGDGSEGAGAGAELEAPELEPAAALVPGRRPGRTSVRNRQRPAAASHSHHRSTPHAPTTPSAQSVGDAVDVGADAGGAAGGGDESKGGDDGTAAEAGSDRRRRSAHDHSGQARSAVSRKRARGSGHAGDDDDDDADANDEKDEAMAASAGGRVGAAAPGGRRQVGPVRRPSPHGDDGALVAKEGEGPADESATDASAAGRGGGRDRLSY